ncbi:MAG TPA: ACP S-malonyltransferase [Fimbriimonadaceae bacterium]|nr:ACP S-malonyltransferase [Fimbriimonadaceae bacterium]
MVAVVFPGQGSQKPGMGKSLFDTRSEARRVFETVSQATGVDAAKLCFDTDEETLRQTQNAQLALYACGVAAWACLDAHLRGVLPVDGFAGHSVGEYAALAASGTVSVEEGARLVQRRGEIMARAGQSRPGTMAAVLGLERDQLDEVCRSVEGVVVVANDNCPGQLVISGDVEAVRLAGEAAQAKGAKRVLPLNVSGAFHSPLMAESASEMRKALDAATFAESGRVISNVTAQPVVQPGRWPELLEMQLKSPVRWTETIQNMLNEGIDTFVECGAGDVLSGLIRRIDREAKTLRVNDFDSLEATVAAIRA